MQKDSSPFVKRGGALAVLEAAARQRLLAMGAGLAALDLALVGGLGGVCVVLGALVLQRPLVQAAGLHLVVLARVWKLVGLEAVLGALMLSWAAASSNNMP